MAIQKSSIYEIADIALAITKKCISENPETVVGIKEENKEWSVTVEVLERKAIPDTQDLLGRYVIRLNKNGELIGWTQQMIRRRCDRTMLKQAVEEE
jgi:hypothetical protein